MSCSRTSRPSFAVAFRFTASRGAGNAGRLNGAVGDRDRRFRIHVFQVSTQSSIENELTLGHG